MLDENDFAHLREQLTSEDAVREQLIKESRDALKASKHAIYRLHSGNKEEAEELLASAQKVLRKLSPLAEQHHQFRRGGFSAAVEEYVEGKLFLQFFTDGKLLKHVDIPEASPEEYLLGLCDFTGELTRHAVHAATERKQETVTHIQQLIDAIMGQLLQFEFRNSELRRKYDQVKYNLKKVEQLRYELA